MVDAIHRIEAESAPVESVSYILDDPHMASLREEVITAIRRIDIESTSTSADTGSYILDDPL